MFFQRAPILLFVHRQFPPTSIAEHKLKQSRGTATQQQFSAAKKKKKEKRGGCDAFGEKKKKKGQKMKSQPGFNLPKRWKSTVIPSQVHVKPFTWKDTDAIMT